MLILSTRCEKKLAVRAKIIATAAKYVSKWEFAAIAKVFLFFLRVDTAAVASYSHPR